MNRVFFFLLILPATNVYCQDTDLFPGMSFEVPPGWEQQETDEGLRFQNTRLPGLILFVFPHHHQTMEQLKKATLRGFAELRGARLSLVSEPDIRGEDYIGGWYEGVLNEQEALAFVIRRLKQGGGGLLIAAVAYDPNISYESLGAAAAGINKTVVFNSPED